MPLKLKASNNYFNDLRIRIPRVEKARSAEVG